MSDFEKYMVAEYSAEVAVPVCAMIAAATEAGREALSNNGQVGRCRLKALSLAALPVGEIVLRWQAIGIPVDALGWEQEAPFNFRLAKQAGDFYRAYQAAGRERVGSTEAIEACLRSLVVTGQVIAAD